MRVLSEPPIVSFARDGQVFELGRSGLSRTIHKKGSTGLGLPPVEIESSARLGGDGSIVRGARYGARDVFIPMRMEADSTAELSLMRRQLNRLVAPHLGEVEIRVQDPATGTDRMIRGLYKEGLEGDFGSGYYNYWQNVGLTFECQDPWWLGPERLRTLQVAPGTKPFLSDTVPFFPVVLASSSVVGEWSIDVAGDADVWPSWEVTGPGKDLLIEGPEQRLFVRGDFPSTPTLFDAATGRVVPDRWDDMTLDSTLFPLQRGTNRLKVSMVGATVETVIRLVFRERYLEAL